MWRGGGGRGRGKVMNGFCVLVGVWRLRSITEAVKYKKCKTQNVMRLLEKKHQTYTFIYIFILLDFNIFSFEFFNACIS